MKFLYNPLPGMSGPNPGLTQLFGNDPVVSKDTWFGKILVRKGQHVYRVLANQAGHNGIDIAAARGEPIYCPADGWIIEQVAKDTGLGLRISIRHEVGGEFFFTTYGHMERLEMDKNVSWNWSNKQYPVRAGQVIGYVDSTGYSTGDHLHWSLYPVNSAGAKLHPDNGYGGAVDPFLYSLKLDASEINRKRMILVNDNGTYFLEGQDAAGNVRKIGIADQETLGIFMGMCRVETRPSQGLEIAVFERSNASLTLK